MMRKSEYPKIVRTLGQRIRKKRLDLDLTLLDVAKQAKITESYLSRIEADKQIPNFRVTVRLAKILNDNIELYLRSSMKKSLSIDVLESALEQLQNSPATPFKKTLKSFLSYLKSKPSLPIRYPTKKEKELDKQL